MEIFSKLAEMKQSIEAIQAVINILAVFAAGYIAYYKLIKRREHVSRIEFSIDVNFVGIKDDYWLVELNAVVENKGNVALRLENTPFWIKYLYGDKPLNTLPKDKDSFEKIDFGKEEVKGKWLPFSYSYVEPSVRQKYMLPTRIPTKADFALVNFQFKYEDRYDESSSDKKQKQKASRKKQKETHTTEKLVRVPKANEKLEKINTSISTKSLALKGEDIEDKRIDRLLDYTKFHIGLYMTLGAGLFALVSDNIPIFDGIEVNTPMLVSSVMLMAIAGLAGGIIASSLTQCTKYSQFWSEKQGPWNLQLISGERLTWVEHTSFWFSLLLAAISIWN